MKTFLEVAKTRHFGKAAENLYLTQSAVSARIKQLEEYFNTVLFVRHRNSIQLTSAGEKLIPYAEQMTTLLEDSRRALVEEEVDYLVCAATPNASELYLQHGLYSLYKSFPDLSIRAEVLSAEQLSRQLHERIVDLGFTLYPMKSEELEHTVVASMPLALYSHKHLDVDTALENYFHVDWGSKISEAINKQFPQTRKSRLKTTSLQVAFNWLFAGGGSIVLPKSAVEHHPEGYTLTLLQELDDLHIDVYLVYMKEIKHLGLSELISFHKQILN
ncbi:LysR family transcriptional regulator [Aestuariibacter sp. AA17]|uniref:LysR family transcriptional regulator n=1 Tax=Fluctibacter corallii TaxID=2984329 RepID=A0ABT3A695_9ALTE|nr:LysR family transcriptional regulator [Aestuariibacter sp. AA17]MCV2884102.1 LysR family transcriptional regulator [Aestuariibacter sp. AA17]